MVRRNRSLGEDWTRDYVLQEIAELERVHGNELFGETRYERLEAIRTSIVGRTLAYRDRRADPIPPERVARYLRIMHRIIDELQRPLIH